MGASLTNSPEEQLVLKLEARKSFTFGLRFRTATGGYIDITGADIRLTAARVLADDQVETVFTAIAVHTESALGMARVDIQAADVDLEPGSYYFALTVLNGGYSSVVAKGVIELQQNVEFAAVGQDFMTGDPATTLDVMQRANGDIHVTQGEIFPPTAGSIPPGGTTGQSLVKISNESYDLVWSYAVGDGPIPAETIPEGQVVTATGADTWEWRELPLPDLAQAELALEHALAAVTTAAAAVATANAASAAAAAAQGTADGAADEAGQALQNSQNTQVSLADLEQQTVDAQIAASGAQVTAAAAEASAALAETAAEQAAADAAAAAGVAGGKADVRIQDTEPAVELQLSTTLWIDTTAGENTPKRWNGAAWVVITDKAATDAADAAVAAQEAADAADAKADAAAAAAAAAAVAAGNAQASADGKNAVWYQTTAPAGTAHAVDDVWFDTDQGNRIFRWNGSAWIATQFGTSAIADLAITNAKIGNLDAAKITAASFAGINIVGSIIETSTGPDRVRMDGTDIRTFVDGLLAIQMKPEGIWAYDALGNVVLRLSSYTASADMAYVNFMQVLNLKTDGIEIYTDSAVDAVGPSIGYLTSGFSDELTLFSNNRNIVIRNDNVSAGTIEVRAGSNATGTAFVKGGTVSLIGGPVTSGLQHSRIDLTTTEIIEEYESSWRVRPAGTPSWAGGPATGTVAIHASNSAVSVAYGTDTLAANTYLTTSGGIRRTSSSLRYKQDVEDLQVDLAAVLAMRPRTWRDKRQVEEDPTTTLRIPGFVAEELDALGLTEFVTYEANGPESIQYDRLSAAQQLVLVDHQARIVQLEEQVAALTAAVAALQNP